MAATLAPHGALVGVSVPARQTKVPLLGPGPLPGLWLACGHHRNGVLLAAITAELTASAVMQKAPNAAEEALLGAFRWERFEN